MKTEQRLKELGIELAKPTSPMANYVNAVRTGNLLYLAGKGPGLPGHPLPVGKVGRDFTREQGYEYARQTGLSLIAVMKDELGDLDRVKRIVKLLGMVNATPEFGEQPEVINGCSDLFVTVFGDRGRHARSAVGMGSLPRGIPVEIEVIVEVEDAPAGRAAAAKPAAKRKAAPKAQGRPRPRRSRPRKRRGRAFDRPLSGLLSPRLPTGTVMSPTPSSSPNSFRTGPDERGHFGLFGGRYVAETLMPLILELEQAYNTAKADPQFQGELSSLLKHYAGRPSPLYYADRLTKKLGGAKIYLKRDELNHTGSHKINNVLGQVLLAKRMGKTRVIAETGAGQHGVATATACALFDIPCVVFMGSVDVERQAPNVFRMKMLGAEVRPVTSGASTLKDAMNEAMRDWVATCETTFYCIGTVAGPHPYPSMVRDFQCVIGNETRTQMMEAEGRIPDTLVACIGGGSNAMGLFHPFLDDKGVRIVGVEAAGHGIETGQHAASLTGGRPGVLHGNRTYLLQDKEGQIIEAHSISAGLDYPGIGPEHSWLKEQGRVEYVSATDDEALDAFQLLCKLEGIIPALESSHALAHVTKLAPTLPKDNLLVANLSGRGDKDVPQVAARMGIKL